MNIIQNNFPGVGPDHDIHVLENVRRAVEHEDKIKRILINIIITTMIMINITMVHDHHHPDHHDHHDQHDHPKLSSRARQREDWERESSS